MAVLLLVVEILKCAPAVQVEAQFSGRYFNMSKCWMLLFDSQVIAKDDMHGGPQLHMRISMMSQYSPYAMKGMLNLTQQINNPAHNTVNQLLYIGWVVSKSGCTLIKEVVFLLWLVAILSTCPTQKSWQWKINNI